MHGKPYAHEVLVYHLSLKVNITSGSCCIGARYPFCVGNGYYRVVFHTGEDTSVLHVEYAENTDITCVLG